MTRFPAFLTRALRPTFPLAVFVLAATSLAVTSLVAQETEGTFEDSTSVVEVQVPVNVTNRDGQPIRGLSAEDFEIRDDGDRREITGFEVIDLEVLAPREAERELERLPSVARRHFLLLFDFSFSQPSSILKAREAAKKFVLESLHPSDLVAVATFSLEAGPDLVITFTPDRGQLAHAIETLGFKRDYGVRGAGDPLRFIIQPPEDLVSLTTRQESNGDDIQQAAKVAALESFRVIGAQMQRAERANQRSRITAWSRSMGDMAKSLNAVKGRKHVVYFSEGFDSRLMLGNAPEVAGFDEQRGLLDRFQGNLWMVDSDETYGNTPLQNDVERMLESFRRADCIVQAVDIAGLRGEFADSGGGVAGSVGTDGLFMIAEGTGGALFEDANDFGSHLERVLERSEVTYVLTFRTDEIAFDGEYHRLQVDLAERPERGIQLSHRSGYYAPRPYKELHPLERSLLASDAIATATDRSEVGIELLAAPFRASDDSAYVPVIAEVDGGDLLLGQSSDQLNLEIYAYVTDDTGAMRDFFTQSIGLDISTARATIEAGGIKYYGHMRLKPGKHLLRVLARNTDNGRTGVSSVTIDVPAWDETEPVLLKPFFMETPGSWVLVREPLEGETVVYPFVVNGEPFVPSALPHLGAHETATLCLVAYNLGEQSPALQSWVADENGEQVYGAELALRERTITGIRGLDKLVANFRPEGLDAGRYTLNVALTDPVSGNEETTTIPFVVTATEPSLAVARPASDSR